MKIAIGIIVWVLLVAVVSGAAMFGAIYKGFGEIELEEEEEGKGEDER